MTSTLSTSHATTSHDRTASVGLEPTDRTRATRGRGRVVTDRDRLMALLSTAQVAHVGLWTGEHPVVLPTAFGVDPDGPDPAGTLYLHGSVASGWLRAGAGREVCVSVTELDGLVVGRSAFHHSMNYRSAVVIGAARVVDDEAERQRALDLVVDHMVPGRAATLRPSTRKELAATLLLAVGLHEASMKERGGGPVDDPADVAAGTWGGHVPVRRVLGAAVPDPDAVGEVPEEVARLRA